jgi:hypothetical protein
VNLLVTPWLVGQPGPMPRDEERADEERADDDLATAIERVRADQEFMERLARLIDRDREILERLAGNGPRES